MFKIIYERCAAYEVPTWTKVKGLPVMKWKHKFPWSYSQFEIGFSAKRPCWRVHCSLSFAFSEFGYWSFDFEGARYGKDHELRKMFTLNSPCYNGGGSGKWSYAVLDLDESRYVIDGTTMAS
jgi:hypothetical protein